MVRSTWTGGTVVIHDCNVFISVTFGVFCIDPSESQSESGIGVSWCANTSAM